ncbi:glycosyltransferase family 39 protein, partial [Paraglaciecola sp.]|uniref:glycosyltransferase family 39 protein n=1 Tax=Paraglaciecola sp. TaxID=1920173 RepID=UPI003EF4F71C
MEQNTPLNSRNNYVFLLVLFFIGLTIRITQHYGFLGTDDSVITTNALRILHDGMYTPFTHYDSRLGLILPVYIIFEILGTGVLESSIFPIVTFLLLPLVLYKIGIHIGLAQNYAFLAGIIVLITPINIAFGSSNYPEVPFSFMVCAAIYFFLKSNIHLDDQKSQLSHLLIAVFFLFWAYLIKIEIIFVLAGISFFFLINKKFLLAISLLIAPLAFMIIEDLLFYLSTTDNFLNRLDILTSGRDSSVKTASHGGTQLWVFPKS